MRALLEHAASERGGGGLQQMLHVRGADGSTAADLARANGHEDVAQLLKPHAEREEEGRLDDAAAARGGAVVVPPSPRRLRSSLLLASTVVRIEKGAQGPGSPPAERPALTRGAGSLTRFADRHGGSAKNLQSSIAASLRPSTDLSGRHSQSSLATLSSRSLLTGSLREDSHSSLSVSEDVQL